MSTQMRILGELLSDQREGTRDLVGAEHGRNESDYWVERGRSLIVGRMDSWEPLKEILGDVPYTYEHFLRLFKSRLGMTPHAYRERKRIERARELLRRGDRSITSVAYALGYSSSQHFATSFKRCMGETPRDYRKRSGFAVSRTSFSP